MIIKIVTPYGTILESDNVKSISVPTNQGLTTAMEDHIPLLTTIESGEIEVNFNDGKKEFLAVSKGILDIRRNSIVYVMADTAERASQIDLERAIEAKKRAEEYLNRDDQDSEIDIAMIEAKIEKEISRINVGKKYKDLKIPN